MQAAVTKDLAQFVHEMIAADVPAEAEAIVASGFIDTIGVMLAGADEPVVEILARTIGASDGGGADGRARACLSDLRLDAPQAALLGGTAAHALDYDDVAMSSHPSAVLVPAILAEGEALRASGRELVAAYVAGYEVWADLFARDRDYHRKGWHPTAIFGPIAAAAAACVLRRLSTSQTVNALALAASHAGGLVVNFGTMTKPYHAGRAAQDGLLSARLAQNGMTASADALEHAQGFLAAVSPAGAVDRSRAVEAGRPWAILRQGLNVKRYPTCYATHRSIDAMIDLAAANDLQAGEIASIEVTMGVTQASALRNSRPATGLEAKFSEEFAMASAIVHRRVGLRELTDATAVDEQVRSLYPRVTVRTVDEHDPSDPTFSPTEDVVVTLTDGRVLEARGIRYAKGHARNALTRDELWAKFSDCAAARTTTETARRLFDQLAGLADLRSAGDLVSVVPAKRRARAA